MKPNWKKNKYYKPQTILDNIIQVSTVNNDNSISYSGFEYMEVTPVLFGMIDFSTRYTFNINNALFEKAILETLRSEDKTVDNLMSILQNLFKEEGKKEDKTYYMLTSISIDKNLVSETLQLGQSNIEFYKDAFPEKFKGRDKVSSKILKILRCPVEPTPRNYIKVVVKTKAKHLESAADQSFYDLSLIRGIYSLFANAGFTFSLGGGISKPVNKILLGGIHTMHRDTGEIADDNLTWFNNDFVRVNQYKIADKEQKDIFIGNVKWVIDTLDDCQYAEKLRDAIVMYVRALDAKDFATGFLKLWTTLETLLIENEKSDNIIKRCSFLFEDYEYHQQILEQLRESRNKNIHDGYSIEKAEHRCYQLQIYFRKIVFFYLHNSNKYETLSDANKFLDLTPNIEELKKHKALIEKAIKFRGGDTNE